MFSTSSNQDGIETEGANIVSFQLLSYLKKILEEASEVLANGFAAGDVALIQFVQNLDGNTDVLDSTNACSFLTM